MLTADQLWIRNSVGAGEQVGCVAKTGGSLVKVAFVLTAFSH